MTPGWSSSAVEQTLRCGPSQIYLLTGDFTGMYVHKCASTEQDLALAPALVPNNRRWNLSPVVASITAGLTVERVPADGGVPWTCTQHDLWLSFAPPLHPAPGCFRFLHPAAVVLPS
ncbi:hypothetical protein O1611_g7572 [Lasiodiplodia mahajangana]|uniref:Uncharacterized protein n=1 Tax=Lasiodiplodia mahajangana TaxID=1108764 RepID=A0ACC2JEV1_9PEZI|nr:hypothetical protein O1611_g7572 [Lasiodiplodia mahajangana]